MRKVTKEICKAFSQGKSKTIGNTRTDGKAIFLHDNKIIYRDKLGFPVFSLCGWNTPTTRERLNGYIDYFTSRSRVGFAQRNFKAVIVGLNKQQKWVEKQIDKNKVYPFRKLEEIINS
jgi:hypothetical protein